MPATAVASVFKQHPCVAIAEVAFFEICAIHAFFTFVFTELKQEKIKNLSKIFPLKLCSLCLGEK